MSTAVEAIYVTPAQFAKRIKRTRQNVYGWITLRKIVSERIGGRLVIPVSEVDRVRENLRNGLPVATSLTLQGA